jgi:hypothetical protein
MIKIFIGDCTPDLAKIATNDSLGAQLLDYSNHSKVISNGTYYTSLSDLPSIGALIKVLEQADEIIYTPPAKWSDLNKGTSKQQQWTEFYCLYFNDKKIVKGLEHISAAKCRNKMLELADVRAADNTKQLWIAGCSISNGDGVEIDERYGHHLANKLDMPVSFLTQGGSSINWAADQILRSDIQPGDIVVWGLTSLARTTFMNDNCDIINVNISRYVTTPEIHKVIPLELLGHSKNNLFHYLQDVYKVINFCSKIKATLVLAGLLLDYEELKYVYDLPNFTALYCINGVEFNERFLDIGNDNIHPGPLTHKFYAEEIYKTLIK